MVTSPTLTADHGHRRRDGGPVCGDHRPVRRGDEVICFDPSYDSYAPRVGWPAASYVVLRCSRRIFASTGGNLPPP